MKNWLLHFQHNQRNRPEPDWAAPITLDPATIPPLVRSLEQFELGDGGGPGYLIAWDREKFLSTSTECRQLVDLWFAEEREHSRLLGDAVKRFGGTSITSHWSFSVFCLLRKFLGVKFELTVLLLTEIVSTAWYRVLRRHCPDPAVRQVCHLILRDEAGHVSFHGDRLAEQARGNGGRGFGQLWALRMRVLMLGAGTMLWVNHAQAVKVNGGTRTELYREAHRELTRFIGRLHRASRKPVAVPAHLAGDVRAVLSKAA